MTSPHEQLNAYMQFVNTYNRFNKDKKISQLEALKIYLENMKK